MNCKHSQIIKTARKLIKKLKTVVKAYQSIKAATKM
jgi:hypothetical protein